MGFGLPEMALGMSRQSHTPLMARTSSTIIVASVTPAVMAMDLGDKSFSAKRPTKGPCS